MVKVLRENIKALGFIILNQGRSRDSVPRVYYGCPEDSLKTAAFLKVKKLQKQFPEYKKGFNLIYTINGFYPEYNICKYAKRFGLPVVYNANGLYYQAWYGRGWQKENEPLAKVYKIADYVIFQSKFCQLSAETFLGPPTCPWEILYNAVDTERFTPAKKKPAGNLILLSSGNHLVFQDLAVVIEAFSIVKKQHKDSRLIIAGRLGSGDDHFQVEGKAQQLVYKLGLKTAVEFQPLFNQEQAPDVYRQADIFVTGKPNNPCPTAVIEAMACGLPIVYPSSGGTPELVGSEAGLGAAVDLNWDVYQVPEAQNLVSCILKVAENHQQMSGAARQRAVEHFDIKYWLKRHQEIFESVL